MRGSSRRGGAHAAVRERRLPRWARRVVVAVALGGPLTVVAWTGAAELTDLAHGSVSARASAPAAPAEPDPTPPAIALPVVHTVVPPPGVAAAALSRSHRRAERSLSRLADAREVALERLAADADEHAERLFARQRRDARREQELAALAALADLPPLTGGSAAWVRPVGAYLLTARFGDAGSRWSSTHTGLDFAAPTGTPVFSVDAGTVTFAGSAGAYGSKVEVTHPDGTVTWYAHLSVIAVAEGQPVPRGGVLGAVGVTGNTSGPHLHFEVRPGGGAPVDPAAALQARGVVL